MFALKNAVLAVVAAVSFAGAANAEKVVLDARFQDGLLSGRMLIGEEGTMFATYGYPGASVTVLGKLTELDMLGLLAVISPKLNAWATIGNRELNPKFSFVVTNGSQVIKYGTSHPDAQEQAILDTLAKLFRLVQAGKRPLDPAAGSISLGA